MTDSENNDPAIIERVLKGNTDLFHILVERHKDISFTVACSIVKDENLAEDVLQDAFIKAFNNLGRFNLKSSFSTWFYRIVVNTSYNALRKAKIRKTDSMENLTFEKLDDSSSFDLLRSGERAHIINGILRSMKPQEALVLRLHYLTEKRVKEISKITNLSVGNVKVLLHRARINFRSQLDNTLGREKRNLL